MIGCWWKVRIKREGWILKRYASTTTPNRIALERLRKEYADATEQLNKLKQEVSMLGGENKQLQAKLSAGQTDLKKVKGDYSRLVTESKDFLELKNKYSHNLDELKKIRSTAETLRSENQELRSAANFKWFLSGGALVLISWLLGFLMGKIKKKSRSSLYG